MPGFKEEFCEDQPYENLARLSNNWGTPQRAFDFELFQQCGAGMEQGFDLLCAGSIQRPRSGIARRPCEHGGHCPGAGRLEGDG